MFLYFKCHYSLDYRVTEYKGKILKKCLNPMEYGFGHPKNRCNLYEQCSLMLMRQKKDFSVADDLLQAM